LQAGDGLRVVKTDDAASQYTETQLFDGHIFSPLCSFGTDHVLAVPSGGR
jgi:hypothetical protein